MPWPHSYISKGTSHQHPNPPVTCVGHTLNLGCPRQLCSWAERPSNSSTTTLSDNSLHNPISNHPPSCCSEASNAEPPGNRPLINTTRNTLAA